MLATAYADHQDKRPRQFKARRFMTENDLPSLPFDVILSTVEYSVLVTIHGRFCIFPVHLLLILGSSLCLPVACQVESLP